MTPVVLLRRLLREAAPFRARIVLAGASAVTLALAQLYLVWIVKQWVDGPLGLGDPRMVDALLARAAVTLVVAAVALVASRCFVASVNQGVVGRLRDRAFERLLVLEVGDARRWQVGDVLARFLHDATTLASFLGDFVKRFVREAVVAAGGIAMMFVLDWRLALVIVALVPFTIGLLIYVGRVIRQCGFRSQTEMGRLGAMVEERLHGLSTIKGFQTEAFERSQFVAQNARFRAAAQRAEFWAALLVSLVFLVTGAVLLVVVWYGSERLTSATISRSALLAFCLYAAQTIEPLRRLSETHGFLESTVAAAARVYELLESGRLEADAGSRLTGRSHGRVRFAGVRFGYRPDRAVLTDVSAVIAPREQVALVGATGSGKTTLARLLVRFEEAARGTVALDDIDVRRLHLLDLRAAVCLVEQEPFLFSGPLLDNIRYGSWDAPIAAVQDAVHVAGLDAVIAGLPRGLQTELAEAGRQLSGGEKQRIALARAIVRNPAVLVLDEATSALDGDTEDEIFARLAPWLARRTVIAITHRLSTARRFGRVLVLQDGRIAGDGSIERLMRECPPCAMLFGEQFSEASAPTALA